MKTWRRSSRRWLWGLHVTEEDFPGGRGRMLLDPEDTLTYIVEVDRVPDGLAEFCQRHGIRATVVVEPGRRVRVEYREPRRDNVPTRPKRSVSKNGDSEPTKGIVSNVSTVSI